MGDSVFYRSGLRFQCTRCSRCCRHTPGYVFLSEDDLRKLSAALGVTQREFLGTYCRSVAFGTVKRISLKEKPNLDCIFWEDEDPDAAAGRRQLPVESRRAEPVTEEQSGDSPPGAPVGGCSVYVSRPLQCRSFPFWSSSLASREEWGECAELCPGIGKGRLHTRKEIDRWLALRREAGFVER
jgi:Fe-S-cluster containining protein